MSYIELNKDNFQEEVLKSELPVIVDFWAPWCGPCRAIAPAMESLAEEFAGKVKITKVNVDQNPELANQYHVMSIPTILFFRNGQVDKQHVGLISKEKMIEKFSL
ncbi:MAG: thioredoxin [Candidatus Cloacimonetes bacterium]|nr:thioredoxin [Candidatus Cloacimonadota bacterium]